VCRAAGPASAQTLQVDRTLSVAPLAGTRLGAELASDSASNSPRHAQEAQRICSTSGGSQPSTIGAIRDCRPNPPASGLRVWKLSDGAAAGAFGGEEDRNEEQGSGKQHD